MKILENIAYGYHPDQRLDLFLPDGAAGFPTFVYFHGGGFEKERGDKTKGRVMAEYLAGHGVAVVCAEYRRYPEAAYPDFIRDCAAAVAWTYHNIEQYGGSRKLFAGGSSAGGYASMMLCFDGRWLAPHRLPADVVAGYFHDAGQPTTHFNVLRERGMDPRRVVVDEAAPLYHIGRQSKYPTMHFLISDDDIKSRYEQTMLVLSTMRHMDCDMSGVTCRVAHGKHCSYVREIDDRGDSVFGRMILDFISAL